MLDSTLWVDRPAREMFLTSLLMAEPYTTEVELRQIEVRSLDHTGFVVPPGKYGYVRAAGVGIARRAGLDDTDDPLGALERLGSPEADSRTPDYDGRRLVRVDGGYIVLNYELYKQRDYTAAVRQRRYRDKKKKSNGVTPVTSRVTARNVTQVEVEAEVEVEVKEETTNNLANLALVPTRDSPIVAKDVVATLKAIQGESIAEEQRLSIRILTIFSYWVAKFHMDNARTKLSHGRWDRLAKFLKLYDLETLLYAIDGAKIHPHMNQEGKEPLHAFEAIFMNKPEGAGRVEKLSEYARKRDKRPKHRYLAKHPELEALG